MITNDLNDLDYVFKKRLKILAFFLATVIFLFIACVAMVYYDIPQFLKITAIIGSYSAILWFIALYYVNIVFINREKNDLKSAIFNFLGVLAVYNVILTINPFGMLKISSDYIVTNIFYFYIAFLIVSFDFKVYEKFLVFIELCFAFIEITKNSVTGYIMTSAITALIYSCITIIFFSYMDSDVLTVLMHVYYYHLAILICMSINEHETRTKYPYSDLNKNKKNYIKTEKYLKKFEFKINIIINWLLDVFKVEKLSSPMFANERGEMKIIHIWNMLVFFLVKIFPLYMFLFYYSNNLYYMMYLDANDKTCEQLHKLQDIVKLDNGNVLIAKFNPEMLEETECKRALIKIKIYE